MRQKFQKNSKGIRDGKDIIRKFRDDICSHVQLKAVKEALDELVTDTQSFGYLEDRPRSTVQVCRTVGKHDFESRCT